MSAGRWTRGFLRLVGNDIGRVYTAGVGTAVAVGSFIFLGHTTFATTALVTGSVLVVMGAMAPWLRGVRWPGGSVDMEAPELQRAKVAKEVADDLARHDVSKGRADVLVHDAASNEVSEDLARHAAAVGRSEILDATRYLVARLAVEGIIEAARSAYSEHEGCEFRFFMFDDEEKKLFAVLRTGRSAGEQRGWRRGEGVTGLAYDTGAYQIATGSATHDGTHNLDEDRQLRYAELTEVAAMPVLNAAGATVGVLSVSHSTGRTILDTNEARRVQSTAADALARVLVDLLGWRSDELPSGASLRR